MTNPALDALDKMEQRLIELCAWHEEGEIEQQAKTIRTALSNAPQWQPIETAPKDGSKFLGHSKYGHIETIAWDADHELFVDMVTDFIPDDCLNYWMPLPAAPNGGG